jgi:hypothetical protein
MPQSLSWNSRHPAVDSFEIVRILSISMRTIWKPDVNYWEEPACEPAFPACAWRSRGIIVGSQKLRRQRSQNHSMFN